MAFSYHVEGHPLFAAPADEYQARLYQPVTDHRYADTYNAHVQPDTEKHGEKYSAHHGGEDSGQHGVFYVARRS